MSQLDEVVSSDLEDLILVNEQDESIGTMPKRECHEDDGRLHRAFSVFIFNHKGEVPAETQRTENALAHVLVQRLLQPSTGR